MAKLKRTLIIGLGGTGFNSLLNAKKMIYDNYGEIPPMIGFLGIDTDKPALQNSSAKAKDGTDIRLNASEQVDITVASPAAIYRNCQNTDLFNWLPKSNLGSLTVLERGAGQVRSNGRFAATVKENTIENYLTLKMNEINNARIIDNNRYSLINNETEIHIVFSVGGGTGCGTFLNIAYLTRRMFPHVKISGYAVLPDVFRQMQPGAGSARVRANSYGALIDLDFLAHLSLDSKPVEVKWFHNSDEFRERPFNALYLIDNRNANNDTFSHVDPLCKMISLALVTSVGELSVQMASIADNVDQRIAEGTMDVCNKKAWVASLGCSEIVFNNTVLEGIYKRKAAMQLINKMRNGGCDDPQLIANQWFTENNIRENQNYDQVIDYFMTAHPGAPYSEVDEPDNPSPEVQAYLTRAMESAETLDRKLAELRERIDTRLSEFMKDIANRECGVFLCENILKTILHETEVCDCEMRDETEELKKALALSESKLKNNIKELEDVMDTIFKKGKSARCQDVVEAVNEQAVIRREIMRRDFARQFYAWLRQRTRESLNRIDIIMQRLSGVLEMLQNQISEIQRNCSSGNFFEFDLAADSVEKVTAAPSDIIFADFEKAIRAKGGVTAFVDDTTGEILDILLDFTSTLPKAKEYAGMTLDEVMKNMSPNDLESLLRRAIAKSQPLLPYDYRGFEASVKNSAEINHYIGVADKDTTFLKNNPVMDKIFPDSRKKNFSSIGFDDRIIIYSQLAVLPMFTVKSLDNYEEEYEKWERDKPCGSHWDQNVCTRMKKERFSLMPNVVTFDVFKLWMQSIAADLITFDSEKGQYTIVSRALNDDPLEGFKVAMGYDRKAAYNFFEDNIDVLEGEIKSQLESMDIPGPGNKLRQFQKRLDEARTKGAYFEEISKCPLPKDQLKLYPNDYELLKKEMTYLIDHPYDMMG